MNLKEFKTKTKDMSKEQRISFFQSLPEEVQKDLKKKHKISNNRKQKEIILRSLGLTKVKGDISGKTYWE